MTDDSKSNSSSSQMGNNWADNPNTEREAVQHEYDSGALEYEKLVADAEYRTPADIARLLKQYCTTDESILDAGCGSGLSGQALAGAGFSKLTGIDFSQAMLELAGAKQVYQELLHGDLLQPLPFDAGRFSAAVCVAVLGHVPECTNLMRELCRVVRSRGRVVFTQRDDLYERWNYEAQLQEVIDEQRWAREWISGPHVYLPGHSDYGTSITVRYHVFQVCDNSP